MQGLTPSLPVRRKRNGVGRNPTSSKQEAVDGHEPLRIVSPRICLALYGLESLSVTLQSVGTQPWESGNKPGVLDLVLTVPLVCCVTGGSPGPSLTLRFFT